MSLIEFQIYNQHLVASIFNIYFLEIFEYKKGLSLYFDTSYNKKYKFETQDHFRLI